MRDNTPERTASVLISRYGGTLVDLRVSSDEVADLKEKAGRLPSIQISDRAVWDLELLATGGFSPLEGFMGRADHERVLEDMRLANGMLFPIPVVLPVDPHPAVQLDREVALRNSKNQVLAILTIHEINPFDADRAADRVFGTRDLRHPLVAEMQRWGKLLLAGPMKVLQLPEHYDFQELRLTPSEVRARLASYGRRNVVAFQTRNPLHRAHEELTKRAADAGGGVLLLHPVVGMTKPGDVDHYTRVRTYRALVEHYYDPDRVLLDARDPAFGAAASLILMIMTLIVTYLYTRKFGFGGELVAA